MECNFKKTEAIEGIKLEGNWWLRHGDFTRSYKDKPNVFYEKVNDRINHGYEIVKLVTSIRPQIPEHHLNYVKVILRIFGSWQF
jgi:hypothetical protein